MKGKYKFSSACPRLRWALCLLAVLLCLPAVLPAQTSGGSGWENEKISLRVSNAKLGAVLNLVAKEARAELVFQDVQVVGINNNTSLNVRDKALHEVMADLLRNQDVEIRYEEGRQIVIRPGSPEEEVSAVKLEISGVVLTADTHEPLIGASIVVVEGSRTGGYGGCITDDDGKFSLRVNRKASIHVSYIGYEDFSMQVLRSDKDMKISLSPGAISMDDVVVTGISKRSETSFTGTFVTVKGEELRRLNPVNFLKSLQFFDPSFKVVENNNSGSDPNAQPEFRLRGDQTFGLSKDLNSMDLMLDNVSSRPNVPLFVLDGFVVSMSRVLELDPQRIENVTILKDAAATAIYGSKASNGVIVIETHVVPDGALSISYNGNYTLQAPDLTGYNMMDAEEKLAVEVLAGVYPQGNNVKMNRYNQLRRNVLAGVNTYWLSQPLRTVVQQRHSLHAAGGTDVFRYSLGINASSQPGVMKKSSHSNKGVDFYMSYRKSNVSLGANLNLSESGGDNSPYGSFSNYTSINPYYLMKDAYGNYLQELDMYMAEQAIQIGNPLYNATVGSKDFTRNLNVSGGLNLEYRILKNLRLTENLSYVRGLARSESYTPANHTRFMYTNDITQRGSYSKSIGEMTTWSSNLGINYNAPIGKHLISLFANWLIDENRSNYVNLSATGYPDVHMDDFIFGNKMASNPSGTEAISRSTSYVGQFSYSYDNRYSLDLNLSAETSSRYVEHNLAPFWSAGLRWNAYREKWLEGRISNLVFRSSVGTTGERGFDPYQAMEFYTYDSTLKPYASFGNVGAVLASMHNPNLEWAKTLNFSVGMDIGFFQNRVNANVQYYNNVTQNMITEYDLAPSTGFTSQDINAGELQNRGVDVSLSVIAIQNVKKQLYWTISANGNHNNNKIRKLSDFLRKINQAQLENKGAPLPTLQEGTSTTTLYTVQSLGIDPVTGKEVFLSRDGRKTYTWDPVDKVAVGDVLPTISGTFSTSLNWRNFTATCGFSYKYGGIVYNSTLVNKIENSSIANNLDRRAAQGRWLNPGDVTRYKLLTQTSNDTPQSTRFLMDDNEIRISTLALGYRFQQQNHPFLRRINVDVVSLNFTTNELGRISTIKMERGLSYPFARQFTLSMSIIFK